MIVVGFVSPSTESICCLYREVSLLWTPSGENFSNARSVSSITFSSLWVSNLNSRVLLVLGISNVNLRCEFSSYWDWSTTLCLIVDKSTVVVTSCTVSGSIIVIS